MGVAIDFNFHFPLNSMKNQHQKQNQKNLRLNLLVVEPLRDVFVQVFSMIPNQKEITPVPLVQEIEQAIPRITILKLFLALYLQTPENPLQEVTDLVQILQQNLINLTVLLLVISDVLMLVLVLAFLQESLMMNQNLALVHYWIVLMKN